MNKRIKGGRLKLQKAEKGLNIRIKEGSEKSKKEGSLKLKRIRS